MKDKRSLNVVSLTGILNELNRTKGDFVEINREADRMIIKGLVTNKTNSIDIKMETGSSSWLELGEPMEL